MDIKTYVDIEIVKNERVYRFAMPVGAPFGEAYDAAFEALNKVSELMKQAAESAARPQEVAADDIATPVEANLSN